MLRVFICFANIQLRGNFLIHPAWKLTSYTTSMNHLLTLDELYFIYNSPIFREGESFFLVQSPTSISDFIPKAFDFCTHPPYNNHAIDCRCSAITHTGSFRELSLYHMFLFTPFDCNVKNSEILPHFFLLIKTIIHPQYHENSA